MATEIDEQVEPAVSIHALIQAINEAPGSSAAEIAAALGVHSSKVGGRLYALATQKTPRIKRMLLDGYYRFYPFNYKLTTDPVHDKPGFTVSVDGEAVRITKVTAEDIAEVERRKRRGKYAEIIDVLEELEPGEAIYVQKTRISGDGLRGAVKDYFKGGVKHFTTKTIDSQYMLIARAE